MHALSLQDERERQNTRNIATCYTQQMSMTCVHNPWSVRSRHQRPTAHSPCCQRNSGVLRQRGQIGSRPTRTQPSESIEMPPASCGTRTGSTTENALEPSHIPHKPRHPREGCGNWPHGFTSAVEPWSAHLAAALLSRWHTSARLARRGGATYSDGVSANDARSPKASTYTAI